VLDVSATAADIERAFQIKLRVYDHPTESRKFFAPDTEPLVDSRLPILHISGLDNYSIPRPNVKPKPITESVEPMTGSGPSGTFAGNDFRNAYAAGTTLTGSGESVALLEFDGYYAADISAYRSQIGAGGSGPQLLNVAVDGGVSKPGSGNVEVALDIEMLVAMAPGLSKIYVYEAPNPSPWVDLLSRMANDNLAKQISCSWGGGGPDAGSEAIFKQMAAQGQSFFNASGDSDAFTGSIPFPSDSPNIIQVGGTTLTTGPGGAWSSETVWNWGRGSGSSGGISTYYQLPSWQQGISMASSQGSTLMRNVPDVALTADNIFVIASNGSRSSVGGTSAAAPLWAAFIALVNQKAASAGLPQMGFLNPALYQIGKGQNYTACFRDVSTGNNTWTRSRNRFFAVAGYDLCTGWGTPQGTNLINALVPDQAAPTVASFQGSPMIGAAPLAVTFTDTSSGTINNRLWDFGNGAGTNTSATNFAFNYISPGTYSVSLTASGPNGTNALVRTAYIIVTNTSATINPNAPVVTSEPENQVLAVGADAMFTAQAAGADPLVYQWRFKSADISGATGLSYIRTNVQPADAGAYDVVVTNAFGSMISSNALLTVVSRPLLLSPSTSSNGIFAFTLSGEAGFNYAIEGTTNFSDWSVLAILPNPAGLVPFADTNSDVMKAYRARLVP
jgi:subtilase family serine protease